MQKVGLTIKLKIPKSLTNNGKGNISKLYILIIKKLHFLTKIKQIEDKMLIIQYFDQVMTSVYAAIE